MNFLVNDPNHTIVSNQSQATFAPGPLQPKEQRIHPGLPGVGYLRGKAKKASVTLDDLMNLPSISERQGLTLTVCGSDNRIEVNNTTESPYDKVCYLLITHQDGSQYRGSGWFSGPGTVITAGHCVYDTQNDQWAKSIEVIPGRAGSEYPFGSQTSTPPSTL